MQIHLKSGGRWMAAILVVLMHPNASLHVSSISRETASGCHPAKLSHVQTQDSAEESTEDEFRILSSSGTSTVLNFACHPWSEGVEAVEVEVEGGRMPS